MSYYQNFNVIFTGDHFQLINHVEMVHVGPEYDDISEEELDDIVIKQAQQTIKSYCNWDLDGHIVNDILVVRV